MTYGLNFPSVPLPYFYQANKMLSGQQPTHPQHQQLPRDEDLDNNCSDEQSLAMSSPQEKPQQHPREKRLSRPLEEDVEVD